MDLVWVVAFALVYVLSSAVAFVVTHRFPDTAPIRFFGWFFRPLDWIALRFILFRNFYNGLHEWSYRHFVASHRDKEKP